MMAKSSSVLLSLTIIITLMSFINTAHYDLPPEMIEQFKGLVSSCMQETNAKKEDLIALNHGDFTKDAVENKKFMMCLGRNLGVLDANGDLDLEKILQLEHPNWTKEHAQTFYDKCSEHGRITHEDHAFRLYRCYYENAEHVALFPFEED